MPVGDGKFAGMSPGVLSLNHAGLKQGMFPAKRETLMPPGDTFSHGALMLGGTVTKANGYRYNTFTSTGILIVPSLVLVSAVLVAGGGSGGSSDYAGGGGAGRMLEWLNFLLKPGKYSIMIGLGGVALVGDNLQGANGQDSTAIGMIAKGGGGGGPGPSNGNIAGNVGGSGGGGGWAFGLGGAASDPYPSGGWNSYGFAGGQSRGIISGGGGGADSVGRDTTSYPTGSVGKVSAVNGKTYAMGGNIGGSYGGPNPNPNTGNGGAGHSGSGAGAYGQDGASGEFCIRMRLP